MRRPAIGSVKAIRVAILLKRTAVPESMSDFPATISLTCLAAVLVELPNDAPPARNQPAMAVDAAREQVVLFGGWGAAGALGDTWIWDGGEWHLEEGQGPSPRGSQPSPTMRKRSWSCCSVAWATTGWPTPGPGMVRSGPSSKGQVPPARTSHSMAYHADRKSIVLFGGRGVEGLLDDMWEWNGSTWRELSGEGPSARSYHALAYDSAQQCLVLFGGKGDDERYDDTWIWYDAEWERVEVDGPGARDHHAMSFDPATNSVVLFGGWNGAYLGDLWSWDGAEWTDWTRPNSGELRPTPRGGRPAFVFFDALDGLLLYGGGDSTSHSLRDLWLWEQNSWELLDAGD